MEPASTKREEAISRTLLIIGLALVAGAILIYHFSPPFQPGAASTARDAATGGVDLPAPSVPAIRGKPVAAFDLPDFSGRRYTPADFRGKVLLINFWATWCGPCLLEIPWFLEFKERYGPEGFEVLAINIHDEGPEKVKQFIEKHKMQPLTVVVGEDKTAELFGGFPGLPVSFLVDRDGNYYSRHMGLVNKDDIEEEIVTLLRQPARENGPGEASSQPPQNPSSRAPAQS